MLSRSREPRKIGPKMPSRRSERSSRRLWRRLLAVAAIAAAAAIGLASYWGKTPDEYVALGDKLFAEGNYIGAIVQYRGAFALERRNLDIVLKLAKAYEQAHDAANTVRQYVRAADLEPENDALQLD